MKNAKLLYARYALALPLILSLIVLLHAERALMQADADPTATAAQAVTMSITASGKWIINSSLSTSNGLGILSIALRSEIIEEYVSANRLRSSLFIFCNDESLHVSIAPRPTLLADPDIDTVTLTFDALPTATVEVYTVGEGQTIHFDDPVNVIESMAAHETLIISYETATHTNLKETFDIRGLSDMIYLLWQSCPDTMAEAGALNPIVSEASATPTTSDDGIRLGDVVMAEGVDRDNCPTDITTTFDSDTPRIYVVAEDSDVIQGTAVFVRWYLNGLAYEDADEIVADQDYTNSCIAFYLEPEDLALVDGNQFHTGHYEAQFIINGNPTDRVPFEIR